MKASARWLNQYVRPGDLTVDQIEHALTHAGFPIETKEAVMFGAAVDTLLDVEVTSNRGDCLSHVGLARELSASTGRVFAAPVTDAQAWAGGGDGAALGRAVNLKNEIPALCVLFAMRVVKGVKVGPSPAWLRDALVAIGQRSINNVVDVTNFVLHELGSPSHVFDLAKVAKDASGAAAVIVRHASAGEKISLLDGTERELKATDMVVADARGAISLAGIMGGGPTSVSEKTTDVLIEVATWSPAAVRATARRLGIRTDSSFRFERVVDARTIAAALDRVADLIVQVAGGQVIGGAAGVVKDGAALVEPAPITLRTARARQLLGIQAEASEFLRALTAQGFVVVGPIGVGDAEHFSVSTPAHRPDVRIEEDLVEELARTIGYAKVPLLEKLPVRVREPQASELAGQAIGRVLTGAGFFEVVTFSFTTTKQAQPFLKAGQDAASVSDDRRGSDNILRPSVLTGLLSCRRANQDAKVGAEGGVRLYEVAQTYAELPAKAKGEAPTTVEHRQLAIVMDVPERDPSGASLNAWGRRQWGVRMMRGVLEALADELAGAGQLRIEPITQPSCRAMDPGATAAVWLGDPKAGGVRLGEFGLLGDAVLKQWDLQTPVVVAELLMQPLVAGYPPRRTAHALPVFPATDRDLSVIVDEATAWGRLDGIVHSAKVQWLRELRFVGVYRGQPIPSGKKSVTLRMVFRDDQRTLRDEDVNAEVTKLVEAMGREAGAVVRTV